MKLVQLSLREWRSFESLDLEFPDGVIGVRGPNGAGKTTIAEAIGWALFGRLRPGAKVGDLKRQGVDRKARSSVELVFRMADTLYRVERVVGGSARLWIGDSDEPETSQTTTTNARLIQELDMTWDTFQRTVYARQKDVAALDPAATAENRKRHVERLLGLERYRVAAERARSQARELEAELRGMRDQAPPLADFERQLREAETSAAEQDPEVIEATATRERLAADVERLDAAVETERERCAVDDRLRRERHSAAEDVAGLDEDLRAARVRLELRRERQERLTALDGKDADLDALAVARRHWETLRARTADLEAMPADDGDFDADAAAVRAERLAALRAELDSLQDVPAADVAAMERRVAALEVAAGLPSVAEASKRARALAEARDEARERRAALRARIEEDAVHLAEIEAGGPSTECRVCLRPYGDDLGRILGVHRERLNAASTELVRLEQSCRELDAEHEAARQLLDSAQAAARDLSQTDGPEDLEGARGALESAAGQERTRTGRMAELRELTRSLAAQVAEDGAQERRHLERAGRLATLRANVAAEANALGVEGYDVAAYEAAIAAHDVAVEVARERETLQAALGAEPDLPERVEQLESRVAQRHERIAQIDAELAALEFDPARLDALRAELAAARADHESAGEILARAQVRAAERDQEVISLRTRVAEAREALAAIQERERDVREHQAAGQLLSDYRSEQNLRAWPKLEQGASALLSEATDGRYADVRLSTDYKLMVYDRGEEFGLERFSGGEQDLANLCLRLSIADWVARERNVEVGFVILDEVFGSQDEDRRRRLMSELASLGNRFHQLLVITHVPDIAEACDHQLEVSLAEPGRSTATLV